MRIYRRGRLYNEASSESVATACLHRFSWPQKANKTFILTFQRRIKVLIITLRPRSFYQFSNKWASFIVNNKWSSLVTTPIKLHPHHILYLKTIEFKAYSLWSRVKITTIRDFIMWPVRPRKQFPWKTTRRKIPYEGRTRWRWHSLNTGKFLCCFFMIILKNTSNSETPQPKKHVLEMRTAPARLRSTKKWKWKKVVIW